jgi:hypothetical protein
MNECKEACTDLLPGCPVDVPSIWDSNYNNSCFGGSSDEPRNGVCSDGGPGAKGHDCAFGTDSDDCSAINEMNQDHEEIPRVHPSCTGPFADLMVDREELTKTMRIETIPAPDDACFVEEGCLGGTGDRKVIRFSTRVNNIGCAPFVVGVPSGYAPGCFDVIGTNNIRLSCPPETPPPPPSPPTSPPSSPPSGQRRLGTESASPYPNSTPNPKPNPSLTLTLSFALTPTETLTVTLILTLALTLTLTLALALTLA